MGAPWARPLQSLAAAAVCLGATAAFASPSPVDTLPSDFPPAGQVAAHAADFVAREAMIPMRDGVKLYTLIVMRTGVRDAPILLERTPYGADGQLAGRRDRLDQQVDPFYVPYVDDGYILVWQDVRGKNRSEGVYFTNRPLSGPLNPTGIDHATDAYDTIDWLVKNVPQSNGRVGVIGGSYNGFTTLMATLSGHPALKAAVAINPMVDVWRGDDWFHDGAFRPITLNVLPIVMSGKTPGRPAAPGVDLYAEMLADGSSGDFMRRYHLDAYPFGRRLLNHPTYDAWWRGQALDQLLAARPIRTPLLLVAGQYDEQDGYGAPAVFQALHPLDTQHRVSLLLGPWNHMGVEGEGTGFGPVRWGEDTAATARRMVIKPFLDDRLKTGAAASPLPAVISYPSGGDQWRNSAAIPKATTPFYLNAMGRLSPAPPAAESADHDSYVSDPRTPTPASAQPFTFSRDGPWPGVLAEDQRFAAHRPDVLSFTSEPLTAAVHIFGHPAAELFAATTGSDADLVVKLIDVYPDDERDPKLRGFELPVSMAIFRARYRDSLETPKALTPGGVFRAAFDMPLADHVFQRGHRLMVQVQSSWFPLYDRNPQTFVTNIFEARPQDYQAAEQTVFHTPGRASLVRLPVVTDGPTAP